MPTPAPAPPRPAPPRPTWPLRPRGPRRAAARATLVLLAVLSAALPARADLARLEALSGTAARNMEAFLLSRAPELVPVMADWSWDDAMRAAAACTLEEIRAEGGEAAVAEYLAAVQAWAARGFTALSQIAGAVPQPADPDVAARVAARCRATELTIARMSRSGLLQAMMAPDTRRRLMAP